MFVGIMESDLSCFVMRAFEEWIRRGGTEERINSKRKEVATDNGEQVHRIGH